MLVTRTPLRIPLGGGGTDLPSYSSSYGGFLVSAAINRYIYIIINRRFEKRIRVSYSQTEIVDEVDAIAHPIVREALRLVGLGQGLEIVSVGDLPSDTGLGSSSAFTVGLLNALHSFKGERLSPRQLAEEAYQIEADILGEPIGKQDQYVAAFGGVVCLEIKPDGSVDVTPVKLSGYAKQDFESSVLLFYTGVQRRASDILVDQAKALGTEQGAATVSMHIIKGIGHKVKESLESGALDEFGELLHQHWQAKKGLLAEITSSQIDAWYELARKNGAVGGKIMGAGGGGFFMFYCRNSDKMNLRRALTDAGLSELSYAFEERGSEVVVNF